MDDARRTIREVPRLVEEAGLVARRQGSGTIVIAQVYHGHFVQDLTCMGELLQSRGDAAGRAART